MAQKSAVSPAPRERAPSRRRRPLTAPRRLPSTPKPGGRAPSAFERLARRAIVGRLEGLASGRLELRDGDGEHRLGNPAAELRATVEVRDPALYVRLATGGSIGAAESYAAGMWVADDLTAVCRILARDLEALESVEAGLARLSRPIWRAIHFARRNSRRGSADNIAAHYDLGNDFFAAFLDRSMTYSCALYPEPGASLEAAQQHKLDTVCRKLELAAGERLVEIGTGWGALAIHAARHYGCRVVTTTISRRQRELAAERVRAAGLEDRVQVLRVDYRELPERLGRRFDKLVSIEMIEAVGHRYLPTYFEVIDRLLEPDGVALVQAILMPDQRYETYRRAVDFIQRHIFPGSLLPSMGRILESVGSRTGLTLLDVHDITEHYPPTLAEWRARLLAAGDRIEGLGMPAELRRMWEFYFCYCEAGFLERAVLDAQLMFAGPRHRTGSGLRGGVHR